jgi:hypothetical protein
MNDRARHEASLRTYLAARSPTDRYASFDYCHNYFASFAEAGRAAEIAAPGNLEKSCLQLGFYLASWGMMRGSTVLLTKSLRYIEPWVRWVAQAPSALWRTDVNVYDAQSVDLILSAAESLRRAVAPDPVTDTLATKILLGVFACVPAFDANFRAGFRTATFSRRSLERVAAFYRDNRDLVDAHRVPTLDVRTGRDTARLYSRAKVIDMIFFTEGAGG